MTGLTPIAVVAAGGLGREVAWLIEEINSERRTYDFLGFLDDSLTATHEGWPVLDTVDGWLDSGHGEVQLVCAIGEPSTRSRVMERLDAAATRYATLVHPTVRRSRWVELAPGCIVCAGCILTTNIQVGRHTIINLDCTIGHDCRLAEFSSLMPGVHISGDVTLGRGVYVGTGANVINGVVIGDWAVIGAGAVVSRHLPAGQIAVGIPAKPIRSNPLAPSPLA